MMGGRHSIPHYLHMKLSLQDCPKLNDDKATMAKVPYSSTIGSLMYAMITTCLDIALVVGVVLLHVKSWPKTLGRNERFHVIFARL